MESFIQIEEEGKFSQNVNDNVIS